MLITPNLSSAGILLPSVTQISQNIKSEEINFSTMRIARSIQSNSVETPFAFGCNLLTSSQISCPRNVSLQSVLRRSYSILSGTQGCACGRKLYYSEIVKAGRSERELETFTSSTGASNSRLSDDSNDDDSKNSAPNTIEGDITQRTADYASSLKTVGLCVFSAVAFGAGLGFVEGGSKASEFFAGYLLEQSLSVDNLFVFILIFKYFQVPLDYQSRVLSYGIVGAVVFRLTLILLGTATIQRFEAVNLFLAAILLYSSFKLFVEQDEDTNLSENFIVKTCQKFIPVTPDYDDNRFLTIQNGVRKATPLLLTVAVIELSDIAFAVDSIPAVFGVTRDPFIVFSSNFFAILGLRSYYTVISGSMAELEYLQPSIGVVLGFIGCKMILDFFGLHVPTEASLAFVATTLSTGVLLSLMNKSDTK